MFLLVFLVAFTVLIIFPFYNVVVVSFTSTKEYFEKSIVLFPTKPTLDAYRLLFKDGRLLVGYKTTLLIMILGLPINMFLTVSMSYGLSRQGLPGKKIILMLIVFTMLFHGGFIALYLVMMTLKLTNTIWSVILAYGINTFYLIIMRNYFMTLPEALVESARLDGAGEWRIMIQIILPLSKPIIATISLFYAVDRWNEWFNALLFIRKPNMVPLQLILRNIVIESILMVEASSEGVGSALALDKQIFPMGVKMAAVLVTMVPVMCVFPFLQRHFVKGIMIGAIKT
ncbi:MAG TPA: carbohydrate ABC transporter permease [Clostridiaceae bacterium]|nr:carbohydrate ABC transporter permease [Clostridiaceae bacterium]